uniref:Uncharacterized protein n=1 Tax=Chromera velia CCMP2878 TaxID=1169474 RepID=A0A0G4H8H1_9ALVE|eukprot:Cvel_25163.t1-p1 / transcript=Cvel_25163.t1 / gene=Cvel_25163 / organism=Chromera_velia_CCMP2878 / gene_product=hypothetical protein / transcript_product=hypothetical protein / location=Cvel_scaffold2815:19150-19527(+) / protein_length=126 / sequence_SO=supercontig / SO=protein_coding / is_pseudo=false
MAETFASRRMGGIRASSSSKPMVININVLGGGGASMPSIDVMHGSQSQFRKMGIQQKIRQWRASSLQSDDTNSDLEEVSRAIPGFQNSAAADLYAEPDNDKFPDPGVIDMDALARVEDSAQATSSS